MFCGDLEIWWPEGFFCTPSGRGAMRQWQGGSRRAAGVLLMAIQLSTHFGKVRAGRAGLKPISKPQ